MADLTKQEAETIEVIGNCSRENGGCLGDPVHSYSVCLDDVCELEVPSLVVLAGLIGKGLVSSHGAAPNVHYRLTPAGIAEFIARYGRP